LSQHSTASSRRERRVAVARGAKILASGCAPRGPPAPLIVVYSLNEAAAIVGVARRTIERSVARGEGPAVIDLSPRRRGVLETDLISWLRKRRRTAPGNGELGA
jgi:hypothetical protein